MKIIECLSDEHILSTYQVMLQLRTTLPDGDTYLRLVKRLQSNEKFRLVAAFDNDVCIAVAGFRVQSTLFRNGHAELYINDLIVDQKHQGQGHGKALINWLKLETYKIPDCIGITLDSGNQRVETHAIYRKLGFNQTALHFYCPKSPEPAVNEEIYL